MRDKQTGEMVAVKFIERGDKVLLLRCTSHAVSFIDSASSIVHTSQKLWYIGHSAAPARLTELNTS